MTDRPAPLTTPETDVRGLNGFILDTELLLASELWHVSTGEEFKAAVTLWCRAWKQTPPGSLPNDERMLASYAGVSSATWRRIRDVAMRGFVLCTDDRLYNKTLCKDVLRAHAKKADYRARTAAATAAAAESKRKRNGSVTEGVTGSQSQSQSQSHRHTEDIEGAGGSAAAPQGPAGGSGGGLSGRDATTTDATTPGSPAPRAAPGEKIQVTALLAEFGLHTGENFLTQWSGLLNHQARCRTIDEARRFLRLAIHQRKSEGKQARLPSHLAPLVDDWIARYRDVPATNGEPS